MSSKGSIMDRAAKWSKEKTNSLWKFEQKLLMNMQSFTELLGLSTSYFVKLTTTGSLKFVLKWTVLMFNHSSNSKESIHLFRAVLKVHLRLLHIANLTDFLFFILAAFYKLVWFILFYWLLCSPHCPFSHKKVYHRIWPNVR